VQAIGLTTGGSLSAPARESDTLRARETAGLTTYSTQSLTHASCLAQRRTDALAYRHGR